MKAAAYIRAPRDTPDDGDRQLETIRCFVEGSGWELAGVYAEPSGIAWHQSRAAPHARVAWDRRQGQGERAGDAHSACGRSGGSGPQSERVGPVGVADLDGAEESWQGERLSLHSA
jgi:hypothetical protein